MMIMKTFNLTTAIFAVISFFQLEGVHGNNTSGIKVDEVDENSANGSFKGTIGVSIYFPQVGIQTILEGYAVTNPIGCPDMTDQHTFSHMGVYYLPGTVDSVTADYLVGLPGTPSIPMTEIPENLDATCDNTNSCCGQGPGAQTPYPFFQDYDKKKNQHTYLDGLGFEITYSNGPSYTDFSQYDQTLALGIPGHYIRKDSYSAYVWTPEADHTIYVPTDMSPSDFMLAAEHVARQMNKEGGYDPERTCQHFSINLLILLKAPEEMIRQVQKFHLTKDDVDCLGTLCGIASILPEYGFEMCGNMGICLPEFGCLKNVNMPTSCIEENPAYQYIDTSPTSWGDLKTKTNTKECWGDGVLCISDGTCGSCCDGYHLGDYGLEAYCGPQTSCWGKDTYCVPEVSCGKCCNSWSMYLTGGYCD